jgi:DNA repair exonuclease SbcCD nuclease subunit
MEVFGALTSTEYHLTSGIHQGIFQKFKFVALGHYHRHQRLARNLIYIGSPIIKDMSEIHDEKKGFVIYDSNNNTFEFIQLEKRRGFVYKITETNLDEVQSELDKDPPQEGDLIEVEFFGTKEWINSIKGQVHKVLKDEYKPLKIKTKRNYIKTENLKAQSILQIKNRIERIKEFSKNETQYTDLGIELYQNAENEYLEVKV